MGLLVILLVGTILVAMLGMAQSAYPDYMYAQMKPEEYAPIHEYFANETDVTGIETEIEESDSKSSSKKEKKTVKLPYVLASPENGHRVVEFYAPWCPHCRHFRNSYIKFAQDVDMLATRFGEKVEVHAISCVPNKDICRAVGVHSYPTIRLYKAASTNGTEVRHAELHPFHVLEMLGVQMEELTAEERKEFSSIVKQKDGKRLGQQDVVAQAVSNKIARTKEQMFSDAFLSFDFALRQGIYMSTKALDDTRADAFIAWIRLLYDTMPPTWKIHRQISAIRDNRDEAVKSEKGLLKLIEPFRPDTQEWSPSCTHGEEGMGYTCGLWQLFHIMTIGVVEFNKMSNEWTIISTMEAADTLRDYISNFFGCEVCRVNFLAAYDACAHDRCTRLIKEAGNIPDWKELALWLWETHNAVNVRLLHERGERDGRTVTQEDEINARWPSLRDCSPCWRDDGSWDEENIYQYLKLEYW
jgi:thiol oxidase